MEVLFLCTSKLHLDLPRPGLLSAAPGQFIYMPIIEHLCETNWQYWLIA